MTWQTVTAVNTGSRTVEVESKNGNTYEAEVIASEWEALPDAIDDNSQEWVDVNFDADVALVTEYQPVRRKQTPPS